MKISLEQKAFTLLILLTFCLFYTSCGEPTTSTHQKTKTSNGQPTDNEIIRGKGKADIKIQLQQALSGKAYLIGILTDQFYRADSAEVENQNTLQFQSNPAYPQGYYYVSLPNQQNIPMILGEDQKMDISLDPNNIVASLETKNLENKTFYETSRAEAALQPQFNQIKTRLESTTQGSAEYNSILEEQTALVASRRKIMNDLFQDHSNLFFTTFKKAGQNPDVRKDLPESAQLAAYRRDFWEDVDFTDSRLLRTPVISNKLKRYMTELTPQHPDSIVNSAIWLIDRSLPYPAYFKYFANWVPLNYEPTKTSLMDPEKVYTEIIQRYHTFDRAFWADSTLIYGLQRRAGEMAGSLLGLKGQDVIASDENGKEQSIYKLKEDYIIVYMFAPDCEHCKEETPKLINWYGDSHPYTVEVFAIGVNTNEGEWKNYIQSTGMPWINVFDPTSRSIYGKYFVDNTPEMYVLNPERTIIAKNIKTHQLDEVIDRDRGE